MRKNVRYAHFAEICEKCGNCNIRIKLTMSLHWSTCQWITETSTAFLLQCQQAVYRCRWLELTVSDLTSWWAEFLASAGWPIWHVNNFFDRHWHWPVGNLACQRLDLLPTHSVDVAVTENWHFTFKLDNAVRGKSRDDKHSAQFHAAYMVPTTVCEKITDFCQIFEYHLHFKWKSHHIMQACRASEKWW